MCVREKKKSVFEHVCNIVYKEKTLASANQPIILDNPI